MAQKDGKFVVLKDIPLDKENNHSIVRGSEISLTHGVFYLNGGMLPEDYQEDFRKLLTMEINKGWKYLHPDNQIVGKSLIGNVDEDTRKPVRGNLNNGLPPIEHVNTRKR